ncbi:BTAD domain-containing putative transcriptional regulator [Mycobacterium asiaticum]|uniref:BTAD domain-containing putative transcriptional regulator n=1 Tax=Mycobacterium asiaticum TaxID=1790 RepID=UPI0007EF6809|nr:BTAD domain-containing putative transcriptional regulator [Mycobacterium asiaticum]OBJ51536.1 hypothetical protein A9W94_26280 [Mycobacterium asiaticum]
MELGVLGPLQVRQRGAPVSIPGAKPRALLTMLGLHGGSVVSAEALAEMLWGENPPRTAAKALQTHISLLRRILGDGFVLTEGAGWVLLGSEIDAVRHRAAALNGREAVAAGEVRQAVRYFDEAVALWRAIPELPDSPRGAAEKTRWIEAHAALVEDRADALLATGRAAEIIGELEAAVADAPLRERRWAQLMLALYRAGRQGEALGAFQRARVLLADELGVDPGPNLRRLEAAIVAQDPGLEIPAAQNPSAVTRTVTFLLTDIEGSTAAWEAEPDAMALALARHDELVKQVVTARGGRLIKTRGEGDATFSVFDRPSAAASAAIELQEAIAHEPWALAEPMRIRVALHTGEVELRDGDYFGRAVNRAARLRSLAVGGQILCSGASAELVVDSLTDDVTLTDLGMRQLRNLARPEHVFELRLDVDRPDTTIPETPIDRPPLPSVLIGPGPFVGRGPELERLLAAWQSAGTNAVLIAGEPGVGKTRLAGEWSQRAHAQGAIVLYGRCDEDLGAPYQPFAESLRSLVPCVGAGRLRGLRGVEALLSLVPGLPDVLPDLASPARADPDTERYALFDAVVALLETASTASPVVLVLDDLHWAAKPTLLLLRHLLRFGDRARVQVVGTYRSTDLDRSHPLAAMLADLHRDGTADRVQLNGLDEQDVTAYVVEAGYDDEELAHALASVTGGNPFFLIEALRHVDESDGVWDQSTLPQGVREAVSRRLSRLSPEANKALAAAAVVGSRFALDLVEEVIGSDLVDAFDEARQAGLVVEEHGGRYRFNHAIVRQSLLAELASVRRMRLHQRIATTLENLPGAKDELLAELAHHYFECAWAGNARKAVEYCRRAADQAMARLAYEGAADLYDRALHALEELDDELPDRADQAAELLVARCEALLAAGDVTSAAGAVSQLHRTTVDSPKLRAWATCFDGQLSMLVHPDRLDEIEVALRAAAEELAGLDDAAGEAKAHTVRAGCLARLGRIGDCEAALDEALTAARRAREHRRVNAVLAGAPLAALWGPNPVSRAGGRCLDVVRLLRITTDSPSVEATSTRCQAVLEAFRGRAAAARRMIDSARRTVTELGLRHALLEVEQFAGIVELVADNAAGAEPHLRQAYNGFRRMHLDADTAETAALLGRTCLMLDRDAEADALCVESERLAGHALKPSIAWRTLRGHLLSRRHEHVEARQVAEDAVRLAERTDLLVDHADACLGLATVSDAAGDAARARAAATQAESLYEQKGAAVLAEKARAFLGQRVAQPSTTALDQSRSGLGAAQDSSADIQPSKLENLAGLVSRRVASRIVAGDWAALAETLATDIMQDDRRTVVGAGLRRGRDAVIAEIMVVANAGVKSMVTDIIAVRGARLVLNRVRSSFGDEHPGAFGIDVLDVVEVNSDEKVTARVVFDLENFDAAVAELDRRYLSGEASAHAHTWAVITTGPAALNRGETPATMTKCVSVDHRRGAAFAPGELIPFISDAVNHDRNVRLYPEAVHRLTDRGAVCTHVAHSVSSQGFDAEWRSVDLQTVDGDRVSRFEIFDEADLDVALAMFDQLGHEAVRLQNAASMAIDRFFAHFQDRNSAAIGEMLTKDSLLVHRHDLKNSGLWAGRDAVIANLMPLAEGAPITTDVIATRGERLVLTRCCSPNRDPRHGKLSVEMLLVAEIDADERIAAQIVFDPDGFDVALQELETRYLAGEAAPYADTWRVITGSYASIGLDEFPPLTTDVMSVDHRRVTAFPPGQMVAYIQAVHRLSSLGAVVCHTAHGTSREGLEGEWREVVLSIVDGEMVNRCELFDEIDLDAALATFDELQPHRQPQNCASRTATRYLEHIATGTIDAMAEIMIDDIFTNDRRRVVGAGIRQGKHALFADMRTIASMPAMDMTSTVVATRGSHLALLRASYSGRKSGAAAFLSEVLGVFQIDDDAQLVAAVSFDVEDIDAAFTELDARYLAGEAAEHAQTWSLVTNCVATLSRHELPGTSADFTDLDHRHGTTFAPGELINYLQSALTLMPELTFYIESVHRLSDRGAVITYAAHGTSVAGFDAEWRSVAVLAFDGDLLCRAEVFDDAGLDGALARFDELHSRPRLPDNAASRLAERFRTSFVTRNWAAMAELLSEDIYTDDRRQVIGAESQRGRDVVMRQMASGYTDLGNGRAPSDVGVTNMASTLIATRGNHLALSRSRMSGRDQGADAFHTNLLHIVETNDDGQIAALAIFDHDDIGAALAELDARYLAGDAAAQAHTWSVIARTYAILNRREIPVVAPDCLEVDHRSLSMIGPNNLTAYLKATFEQLTNTTVYIEAVHKMTDIGAVVTHIAKGTSREGFDGEWRMLVVFTANDGLITSCEMFDETDLDAALARFAELQPPTPQLQNAASRVNDRLAACFAARDWAAAAQTMTENIRMEDRQRVVNSGIRQGRNTVIADMQATADLGTRVVTTAVLATRGQRLILGRAHYSGRNQGADAFFTEVLGVLEIDAAERIVAVVTFSLDDMDAAFAELDARYLAGEAAAHAHTWSLIARECTDFNRREQPAADWTMVDHRKLAIIEAADLPAAVRGIWDVTPDLVIGIEAVHRISDIGAVVTYRAQGTSAEGVDAEWHIINLLGVKAGRIDRCEIFDEAGLDTALARFDELTARQASSVPDTG